MKVNIYNHQKFAKVLLLKENLLLKKKLMMKITLIKKIIRK